jgi:riboflavin kinase/FMN adenylyltransferase
VQLFTSLSDVPAHFGPSAVTIGKFDGVHAGHRAVIRELEDVAVERNLVSTIVTFDRNPLAQLAPEKCPISLISNDQKVDLLASTGVAATLMVTFDREFSEQPPEAFVTDVLVGALDAKFVFVGSDFRFGVRGSGTVDLLEQLGAVYGFEVRRIGEVVGRDGRRRASSTWIRELLDAGQIDDAAALLERLPSIRSTVVHGEQRGRAMGYPTANLSPEIEGFIPADAVYAAWARIEGERYGAAVSVGNNPTFEGVPQKQVEAHLLDQSLDLYGKVIEIEFVQHIRTMNKFDSMDALAEQMGRDEQRIRGILGFAPNPSFA